MPDILPTVDASPLQSTNAIEMFRARSSTVWIVAVWIVA
jgi:hypothetical protein